MLMLDSNVPPPEPWHSFFKELDTGSSKEIQLQCVGGFVATRLYGLPRSTSDIDLVSIIPREQAKSMLERANEGSELHKKYGVYLQHVAGVTSLPLDYEERLIEMYPKVYKNLRFFALEAHDLALSKLTRNAAIDREDLLFLAQTVPLDVETLKNRYRSELRSYASGPTEQHDITLDLWLEMIEEDRANRSSK